MNPLALIANLNALSKREMQSLSDKDLSRFESICHHWHKLAWTEWQQRDHERASQKLEQS
jgi:phage FluMu protein gp41